MVSCNLDSESLIYKSDTATATGNSPDATVDADTGMIASQTVRKCSEPDEDVKDEIVDDPNVISDVKLPEKAR